VAVTADPTADPTAGSPAPAGPEQVLPAHSHRLAVLLLVTAGAALVADVVSKVVAVAQLSDRLIPVDLVPGVLDLELTRNSGAAFSTGRSATLLFSLIAVVVVVAIVRTLPRLASAGWAVSLGLLLGGALGNLIDRTARAPGFGRGEVVDWIHLHHWPVFNLADSAIVIGGVLAVLLTARGTPATRDRATRDLATQDPATRDRP